MSEERDARNKHRPMQWVTPANVRANRTRYTKEQTGGYPPPTPAVHTRELTLRCKECGTKLHVVTEMSDEDERNVRTEWNRIHG